MSYPSNSDSVAQAQIRAFVDRILRLKEEAKAINKDIREVYAEAKGNGFDKTVLGKIVSYIEKRKTDANELLETEALFDLYLSAYDGATGTRLANAHTHEEIPPHDADGVILETEPTGNDAGGAEGEAVANDAEPSAQPIPEPLIVDPSDPQRSGAAEGNEAGLAAQETIATADAPPLAGANDDRGGKVTPPTEPAPVITLRTHNPETHFLTEKGLLRLHGCLNPELCGSTQPRVKLCFDCSRLHDGPAHQGDAA